MKKLFTTVVDQSLSWVTTVWQLSERERGREREGGRERGREREGEREEGRERKRGREREREREGGH